MDEFETELRALVARHLGADDANRQAIMETMEALLEELDADEGAADSDMEP